MDKEYFDVLAKNYLLNVIKNKVRKNDIVLSGEQEKKADEKMGAVIKKLLENNSLITTLDNKIEEQIINSLIQFYVAIYNDNVDFLYKLLDEEFDFGTSNSLEGMNLFVLDKRVSSGLGEENVVKILDGNVKLFKRFYFGLSRVENSDELIDRVCDILKKNKDIAKIGENQRLESLFNTDALNNFSNEEILNLNNEQKKILNNFYTVCDNSFTTKLIKDYNFSKELVYWSDYSKYFSVDEILKLTDEDIRVYNKIFCDYWCFKYNDIDLNSIIKKVKSIKREMPEFNYELSVLVYKILSEKQIMNLSPEGVEKIHSCCLGYDVARFNHRESEVALNIWIKNAVRKDKIRTTVKKLVKVKKKTK